MNQTEEHLEMTKFMVPKGIHLREELILDNIYNKIKYKTRVVVAIYNKGDYDEELTEIKETARKSAGFLGMRIAFISDPKLVKRIKKETNLFGEASMNSIIVRRYDDDTKFLDLLQVEAHGNAYHWIWKKSLKEVEEMS